MNFKKETFDETKCHHVKEDLDNWAAKVNELRERLAQEGLPADREFIIKITSDEMAFDSFVKAEYRAYIARLGFVPQREKERVLENFNTLYFGINPLVQSTAVAISKGIALLSDGTVNEKKIEDLAREAGTTYYDTDAMKSFYEIVTKTIKAIEEVKTYEKKHGLSTNFTSMIFNPDGSALPPRIIIFKGKEEEFQHKYGGYFTVKPK